VLLDHAERQSSDTAAEIPETIAMKPKRPKTTRLRRLSAAPLLNEAAPRRGKGMILRRRMVKWTPKFGQ
jgi:hypothetical protein